MAKFHPDRKSEERENNEYCEQLSARIAEMEAANSGLRLSCEEQDNQLQIAIDRGDEWQSKCYALEGEVAELKEKIQEDDAECLSRLCALYKGNIERLTAENQRLHSEIERLKAEIGSKDEIIDQRNKICSRYFAKIDLLNAEIERLKAELAGRSIECRSMRSSMQVLDAENVRLIEARDLLKAALRWCLENGVIAAIHHVDGKPHPRLVYAGDFDNATPPPEFAAVIAEATK